MPSVTVERQALVKALKIINTTIDRKSPIPVVGTVKLVAAAGKLTLAGTNLDQWISTTIGADLAAEFTACVSADTLGRLAQGMPEGAQISLTAGEEFSKTGLGRVEIKSGRSRYNLSTWPAVDFPNHAAPGADTMILSVGGKAFARALEGTMYACEPLGSARYFLQGCVVELSGKQIEVVATNGHILARHRLPAPDKPPAFGRPIIRQDAAAVIASLVGELEDIKLEISKSHVAIDDGTTRYWSKLLDAEYPDWRRVVPQATQRRAIVDRAELSAALTRLLVVGEGKGGAVKIDCEDGLLVLTRHSETIGDAREELAADITEPIAPTACNPRYLLELVGHFLGAKLSIDQADPASPLRLESDQASHDAVLMPVVRYN